MIENASALHADVAASRLHEAQCLQTHIEEALAIVASRRENLFSYRSTSTFMQPCKQQRVRSLADAATETQTHRRQRLHQSQRLPNTLPCMLKRQPQTQKILS